MMSSPSLRKKEEVSVMDRIESFLQNYATYILLFLIFVLVLLIIALFLSIADASHTTPVMVESGNYYNHLKDVI